MAVILPHWLWARILIFLRQVWISMGYIPEMETSDLHKHSKKQLIGKRQDELPMKVPPSPMSIHGLLLLCSSTPMTIGMFPLAKASNWREGLKTGIFLSNS